LDILVTLRGGWPDSGKEHLSALLIRMDRRSKEDNTSPVIFATQEEAIEEV
jgi:hypothetical protein